MLTLTKKLRRESENNNNNNNNDDDDPDQQQNKQQNKKISIRDRLLVKEVEELERVVPKTCKLRFPDANKLHEFEVVISPDEGIYAGGHFRFLVNVTEEYNFEPPLVRCSTPLWHPNISKEGAVCLSLLRHQAAGHTSLGWAPTRTLNDIVWGLDALFTDLLNFEDPLNDVASEQYSKDKPAFIKKVKEFIAKYSSTSQ